ncbi:MAG: helix-turn-helix domain-containing protein, partial [Bdellovibrionota bacterium]
MNSNRKARLLKFADLFARPRPKDIRALVRVLGTTQAELARALKVNRGAVNQWILGYKHPKPVYLDKIEALLRRAARGEDWKPEKPPKLRLKVSGSRK